MTVRLSDRHVDTGAPLESTLAEALAGERNTGSATNSYLVVRDECNGTVVDVAVNDTQVSAAPAHLIGVYVNTALSAHALPIKDGGTAGTAKVTLPASAAAGTFYDFKGMRFDTDLHVDPNDAATGNITVLWRPI